MVLTSVVPATFDALQKYWASSLLRAAGILNTPPDITALGFIVPVPLRHSTVGAGRPVVTHLNSAVSNSFTVWNVGSILTVGCTCCAVRYSLKHQLLILKYLTLVSYSVKKSVANDT